MSRKLIMPRGATAVIEPRCINCAHFKRVFMDDYMRSDHTNGGACALNPLWQLISNGAQHYCGQHIKSTGPR